ncbi:hypothetical protein [Halovivax limisalsi]|uniref:hypothetical protein n=1 Tax=Halovivax limisalsi TaxID=1453760 RepID=UPI001FFC3894|nr:hypothetical protein [Halovivax limisalsi]
MNGDGIDEARSDASSRRTAARESTAGSDDPKADRGGPWSGGRVGRRNFPSRRRGRGSIRGRPRAILVLAIVCLLAGQALTAGIAVSGDAIGVGSEPSTATAAGIGANASTDAVADDLEPGAQLAAVTAGQAASIRERVDRASFGARLEEPRASVERAAVVDRELGDLERRLTALERRHRSLDESGRDERVGAGTDTAGRAAIGFEAESIEAHLAVVEAAAGDLPADVRSARRLDERIDGLFGRLDSLRARTGDAVAAVEAAGRPIRTTPISAPNVAAAMARLGTEERWSVAELRSERIDLHVRAANGTALRFGIEGAGSDSQRVERGAMADPTVRVHTDYRVIRALERGGDPTRVLREGLAAGRIAIDGVGLRSSVKYGVVAYVAGE